MKSPAQRQFALKLYRIIRTLHRQLPAEMRTLGDRYHPPILLFQYCLFHLQSFYPSIWLVLTVATRRYVRDEFRRHKTAEQKHLIGFFEQWVACMLPLTCLFDSLMCVCVWYPHIQTPMSCMRWRSICKRDAKPNWHSSPAPLTLPRAALPRPIQQTQTQSRATPRSPKIWSPHARWCLAQIWSNCLTPNSSKPSKLCAKPLMKSYPIPRLLLPLLPPPLLCPLRLRLSHSLQSSADPHKLPPTLFHSSPKHLFIRCEPSAVTYFVSPLHNDHHSLFVCDSHFASSLLSPCVGVSDGSRRHSSCLGLER
jgi:hypothetical protein